MDAKMSLIKLAMDKEPYGHVEYADPGCQSDKKKRYPIDSLKHIKAAKVYIAREKNSVKYTPEQLEEIKARINKAWEKIHGTN